MRLNSFQNGTTRFVSVCAVVEFAVAADAEYLTEIVRNLFGFHIERAETFDTRNVDESTSRG